MVRMSMMLLGAGSLALAACAQGEETTTQLANETGSGAVAAVNEPASIAPETPMPSASAVAAASTPKLPPPTVKAAPPAKASSPAKAAPKPSQKSEPSPPAMQECLPEHREMGHC